MSTLPTPEHDFDDTGDTFATVEALFDTPAGGRPAHSAKHASAPPRHAGIPVRDTTSRPSPGRRRLQVVIDPLPDPVSASVSSPASRAPQAPRRVAATPGRSGRIVAGTTALTAATVVVVVTTFLAMTAVFPWLSVLDGDRDTELAAAAKPGVTARIISDPGPSPAEKVVDTVMSTSLPVFDDTKWDQTKPTTSISSPSLGFGCDSKDGLSPAVASTRGWVTADGSTSVTISARAYSAGAGAIALDGLTAAATTCAAAWLDYPALDLGVETEQIASRAVTALVWRRGDVLVTAQVTAGHAAGDPATYTDALRRLDDALDRALTGVCVDQDSGADDATRSPYVDRRAYTGYRVEEDVVRPDPKRRTAEQRIERDPALSTRISVVPTPAPVATLPEIGTLPSAPYPAPTSGPQVLPEPVTAPAAPVAPSEPDATTQVQRAVADTVGPGCGWQFTGQTSPVFDSAAAAADYNQAVTAAENRLTRAWATWQDAKVTYYTAYARYLKAVKRYKAYAVEVAAVRAAWQVIEDARAEFYTAHANWQDAVDARDAWRTERADARAAYQASRQACRAQEDSGADPGAPDSDPTTSPDPETPGPTGPPVTDPTPGPTPNVVCPPVRPEILDETPPTVPDEPVPAPEAQLPR